MEIITQNEKILYIGIDVHKDTFSLCCFDFQKNELSDEMTGMPGSAYSRSVPILQNKL